MLLLKLCYSLIYFKRISDRNYSSDKKIVNFSHFPFFVCLFVCLFVCKYLKYFIYGIISWKNYCYRFDFLTLNGKVCLINKFQLIIQLVQVQCRIFGGRPVFEIVTDFMLMSAWLGKKWKNLV